MRSERHSIIWQMLLPIPIVSGLALVAAAILLPPVVSENAVESAVESARQLVDGFRTARTYYSKGVAAKLVDQSCVNCHNTFPGSPKTDWKLGDVRGIVEIDTDIDGALARGERLTQLILVAGALVAGLLALLAAVLARRISVPIKTLTTAMRSLAGGDHDIEVPAAERRAAGRTMAAAGGGGARTTTTDTAAA